MMQTAVDLPNVYADDYDKLLTINDFNVIVCLMGTLIRIWWESVNSCFYTRMTTPAGIQNLDI